MSQERIVIRIADIVIGIFCEKGLDTSFMDDMYRDFLCVAKQDVAIHVRLEGFPKNWPRVEDKEFDSEHHWSLFGADGQNILTFKRPEDLSPYRIAAFDQDYRRGEIYLRALGSDGSSGNHFPEVLDHSFSQILMTCILARGRGFMVHGCGIEDAGQGYLFAGNSGHGKSTLARLWEDKAHVLNDDRMVLRKVDGRFWMYGTPWHGDYTAVSPKRAPLDKIFFLQRGQTNIVAPKNADEASCMLLTRGFPPLWDKKGMSFTLDFLADLCSQVPAYDLGFLPDESVIEFVRCKN